MISGYSELYTKKHKSQRAFLHFSPALSIDGLSGQDETGDGKENK